MFSKADDDILCNKPLNNTINAEGSDNLDITKFFLTFFKYEIQFATRLWQAQTWSQTRFPANSCENLT